VDWSIHRREEIRFEKYSLKLKLNNNKTEENNIPFEIKIPENANKSYKGKLQNIIGNGR
jgi:hypothetical protein